MERVQSYGARAARVGIGVTAVIGMVSAVGAAGPSLPQDECVACHGRADLLVSNRKLYDYFQQWKQAPHTREGVGCVDCHGGDPQAPHKDAAHRGTRMRASDPRSPVHYRHVDRTCGRCHEKIYTAYRTSAHAEKVEHEEGEPQGPTCVTCHGSTDVGPPRVTTMRRACRHCHNRETGTAPKVPRRVGRLMYRLFLIHRYQRDVQQLAEPSEAERILGAVEPRVREIEILWHTFDLERLDRTSLGLYEHLRAERAAVRARHPRPTREDAPRSSALHEREPSPGSVGAAAESGLEAP